MMSCQIAQVMKRKEKDWTRWTKGPMVWYYGSWSCRRDHAYIFMAGAVTIMGELTLWHVDQWGNVHILNVVNYRSLGVGGSHDERATLRHAVTSDDVVLTAWTWCIPGLMVWEIAMMRKWPYDMLTEEMVLTVWTWTPGLLVWCCGRLPWCDSNLWHTDRWQFQCDEFQASWWWR